MYSFCQDTDFRNTVYTYAAFWYKIEILSVLQGKGFCNHLLYQKKYYVSKHLRKELGNFFLPDLPYKSVFTKSINPKYLTFYENTKKIWKLQINIKRDRAGGGAGH